MKRSVNAQRGFTLLEVMIAMAILASALTWLVVGLSRNIAAENHAKLTATATFLAREKMVEFEDTLYDKGFSEFDKEVDCTFEEQGFRRYTCKIIVDKVELPSAEQVQTALTAKIQASQGTNGTGGSSGGGGGLLGNIPGLGGGSGGTTSGDNPITAGMASMAQQFGLIKDVLEQGIRRITVRVLWKETNRPKSMELVAYFTDVRKVDQAIQLAIPTGAGTTGGGTTGGTTGSH